MKGLVCCRSLDNMGAKENSLHSKKDAGTFKSFCHQEAVSPYPKDTTAVVFEQ